MPNLLDALTNTDFMPRGHCYSWEADVLWLHAGSNAVLVLAYSVIPAALFILVSRNRHCIPHQDIAYLFIIFIFLCGLSSGVEIITTWIPAYYLEGLTKAVTASVSLITALVLASKLPEILMSSPSKQENELLKNQLRSLEMRIGQMNSLYEASLGREDRIAELKKEVNAELAKQGHLARYNIPANRNQ